MTNVGGVDRLLRFLIGVVLLIAVFVPQLGSFFEGWGSWKYLITAVGAVMLATSIFGFCPAYTVFGINTCAKS